MQKDKTLVVLAGGLGSRFQGLKQVEPIDEHGNFIIDYSIYDARHAGFNKVVFVIKEENLEIFKSTIGNRIANFIDVDYAFQGMSDFVPNDVDATMRKKPFGTGHALLCAANKVKGDFTVINADDFYGREGLRQASQFFDDYSDPLTYAVICYKAKNTLTDKGKVRRGICDIKDGYFINVVENNMERIDGKIFSTPEGTQDTRQIDGNILVNMNLLCFRDNFFDILESQFELFLRDKQTDIEKDEFLLLNQMPYASSKLGAKMKVFSTSSVWYGVTYREDKESVTQAIKTLIEEKVYPENLWQKEN